MRRNFWLGVAVSLVCTLALGYTGINLVKAGSSTAKKQKVQTLVSNKIPVNVGSATVTNIDNRNVLTYSVNNLSNEQLTNIQVTFFIVDSSGRIKGGQGWSRDINLYAGSSEEFALPLQHNVDSADHLVLAVSRISGPTKAFEVESDEMIRAAKAVGLSRNHKFNANSMKVTVMSPDGGTASYCSNALKTAQGACKCGVSSFSCNENTGYSFSCFGPDSCSAPVEPPQN
ncbi:MAG TPA: hypothetical protein VF717_05150 [Pyrinomonadaceae bacterium]|jgi:hypothetical protein